MTYSYINLTFGNLYVIIISGRINTNVSVHTDRRNLELLFVLTYCGRMEIFMDRYIEKRFCYTLPSELNMYYCGKRINTENHSYGPQVREHFLLVFVKSGKALVTLNNKHYTLCAGQLFCMYPHEKIYYKAYENTLWSNLWLGIYGTQTELYLKNLGISREYPIYTCPNPEKTEKAIDDIITSVNDSSSSGKILTVSKLYTFFSTLYADSDTRLNAEPKYDIHNYDTHEIDYFSENIYIRDAENYIRFHYDKDISVQSLADRFNLSPEYFSRLFKKETGKSPKEMIIEYRINTACNLLKGTNLCVSEAANCVGIHNSHYFSRLFKKYTGLSPAAYKKKHS